MTYLQRWRIRLAEQALRTGDTTLAHLAATLGSSSESALSTAFKKATGLSPRAYRNLRRA